MDLNEFWWHKRYNYLAEHIIFIDIVLASQFYNKESESSFETELKKIYNDLYKI